MGMFDYLLLAAIMVLVFFAIRHMRRNKGSCHGCQNCQDRKECVKR